MARQRNRQFDRHWYGRRIHACWRLALLPAITAVLQLSLGIGSHVGATQEIPQWTMYEVAFAVTLPYQNPFDSSSIQVDALIRSEDGSELRVPCFFDGEQGWKMRFTPSQAGRYRYTVQAASPSAYAILLNGELQVVSRTGPGFVRVGRHPSRHFVFDNGASYFPVGENLGWVNPPNLATWQGYLEECRSAGVNWIRIWMCSWGNTELEWTPRGGRYAGLGSYDLQNARMLDGIFKAAEERGICIQLVINHHGQYSTQTNPIWDQNPYNTKNGGFLSSPELFFTDPEAQRHYRDRLRYLVARWGYSASLMAWEFWNEVDLTSQYQAGTVAAWHRRMADFLQILDPYRHLKTTSAASDSAMAHAITNLDYRQTHNYITNLRDTIQRVSETAAALKPDKPHFHGEMSYDYRGPNTGDREGVILHQQLWASVHSWDAGTAMTWWWDNWVRPYQLYFHFKAVAAYVADIDWDRENLQPMAAKVTAQASNRADFRFAPLLGWAESRQQEFEILPEGKVLNLEQCTQFVHGQYHRDMAPNPVFVLETDDALEFAVTLSRVARAGARLRLLLDGNELLRREFPPAQNDVALSEEFIVRLPPGRHRLDVRNDGLDWFQVRDYRITDWVQRPVALVRGNPNRILIWVYDRLHDYSILDAYGQCAPVQATRLLLPDIRQGEYRVEQFDPYLGTAEPLPEIRASPDGLWIELPAFKKELAYRLQWQRPTAKWKRRKS